MADMNRGDTVKLKGRSPRGVIKTMDPDSHWICVAWDVGNEGPKYVHEFELQVLTHG